MEGKFLVIIFLAYILFYSSAMYSFIFVDFRHSLCLKSNWLYLSLEMDSPLGRAIVLDYVCLCCLASLDDLEF